MSSLTCDYFGILHVSKLEAFLPRHINTSAMSGPLTSSSWTIHSVSPPFLSSAGFSRLIQRMVRAQMIKIGYICPKAQQAAGEGRGRGGE